MRHLMGATMLLAAAILPSQGIAAEKNDDPSIARGRYVAKIGGCNDCHTPDYAMSGGQVPESQWLVGSPVGWRGPWGTTYPSNLRLVLTKMSEDEWLKAARKPLRPPMPWFTLRDMSDDDLRALYRFVRSLGSTGQPAPAYIPPDQTPAGPVITFPSPPPQKAAAK